ncbi:hypothetical protein BV509_07550 [Rhodovulum sulfidophilum]|uniref:DUF4174 domain-containing protein n=1 Tax=Rhodovulum visakhapatnamense TaxID=364297 RepID=A0ABS1RGQ4_9RHOB|nr:DUF4174 domain-containing protein [Rhodovulum visakhapatnamense]MBL3570878.1 DUF4174 domain-containing protein [Rhodovulum visakhapatnamense]MBL3578829.1 DUF4174 domain-containing protein [Rhodovulum visakhapatnamense]OLS44204.1 hypothetical protein BV509_07550 [Rhodovulum sulfidophilum]
MKKYLTILAWAALVPLAGTADAVSEPEPLARWEADRSVVLDAAGVRLSDFHWIARPVVVFADSPADPQYRTQMQLLTDRIDELAERDVVVIADTDPEAQTELRTKLRPRGFMLVLIGKDGGVKFRKPLPWNVREISRSIDKIPLRQQEIRDRR